MASTSKTTMKNEKVGIIGSGLIGRSWAMLFAAGGYNVVMYDIESQQVKQALEVILDQLHNLEKQGLLKGSLSVTEQYQLISGTNDLSECVKDTKYIQECVPENLKLKEKVFAQIDAVAGDKTILASSTSSMPISKFTSNLKHKVQCIVSHPCNPPFYCPLTEVVPAPYTDENITKDTMQIMKEIGMSPVLLKKELEGFALNRMQYALLSECWRLIQDDAISLEDLDTIMKDGLGMRYAFMGPMETIHLNAEGIVNYCDRYGEMIEDICKTFGPAPKFGGAAAKKMEEEVSARIPVDQLNERRMWRDGRLAALAQLKKKMDKQD